MDARQVLTDIGACVSSRFYYAGHTLTEAWDDCDRIEQKAWFACMIGVVSPRDVWDIIGREPKDFEYFDENPWTADIVHDAIQEDFSREQRDAVLTLLGGIDIEKAVENFYAQRKEVTHGS